MNQMFFSEDVTRLLRDALREDIGTGDITTLSVIDSDRQGYGIEDPAEPENKEMGR